jgi:hypothetical protein
MDEQDSHVAGNLLNFVVAAHFFHLVHNRQRGLQIARFESQAQLPDFFHG